MIFFPLCWNGLLNISISKTPGKRENEELKSEYLDGGSGHPLVMHLLWFFRGPIQEQNLS